MAGYFGRYNKEKEAINVLSEERQAEINLCGEIYFLLKQAMVNQSENTKKIQEFMDAWKGDYFKNNNKPDYKSDQVSNFIYSIIETIRPIMLDGNPTFLALARKQEGMDKAEGVQIALDFEFDRERMLQKLMGSLITCLVTGTVIFAIPWNGKDKGIGNVKCFPINPLNFYVDPVATSLDDAEYCMYATYINVNLLKKMFPNKANLLEGSNINYKELVANRDINSRVDNQVLVVECHKKDYAVEEADDEIDGKKVRVQRLKYPNGRVITCAPELQLILDDKKNIYKDGEFPFEVWKDIEVPFEFFGRGEVEQLLSPQKYINELNNQIIDNAKITCNMPWIIDKNSGIGFGKLTNRPGLVIRKNPGSEVRRDQPPTLPNYIMEKVLELKNDMETISGIYDATRGERPAGIQAGNAIVALQEAGQARIRLKVKVMELFLGRLATKWYSRMQQFWLTDRWVRVVGEDGSYSFKPIKTDDLKHDFDITVTAGSTMPKNKNSMLDLVIRLAQTQGEDGLPILDRKTVLDFIPIVNKKEILKKFEQLGEGQNQTNELVAKQDETAQIIQQLVKEVQGINGELQKLQSEYDGLMKQHEQFQIEKRGYDKGYKSGKGELADDEKIFLEKMQEAMNGQAMGGEEDGQMMGTPDVEIPDEVLDEIANMSDDELMAVMQQYPQLAPLIQKNLGTTQVDSQGGMM